MSGRDPREGWRFRWRLAASRVAHAFEEIWPALWPSLAVIGLFLVISLFGLWRLMPGWLHGLGLAAFLLALGYAIFSARGSLRWPSRYAGLGRLEEKNALPHRPLRSLDDQLAGGHDDPLTRSLWKRHRERLVGLIDKLKVGLPTSDLPRRDRWALRIGLALLLIVAAVEAGNMAPKRLAQAFDLNRPSGQIEEAVQLTVWVTPPDYTGLPAETLSIAEAAPGETLIDITPTINFPAGSEVLAQLHHVDGPVERYALSLAGRTEPFASVGGSSAEAKVTLDQEGELKVGDPKDVLGVWQVEVRQDEPPTIDFAEDPAVTQRQVMRFALSAADDYGVSSIALYLNRPGRADDEAERVELIQPAEGATEVDDAAYLDLTPHPWSGLPVEVKLEAVDGIGQTGFSEVLEMVLPTRNFTHPVARAIIEQRRMLADQPDQREKVAAAMNGLSHVPERFQNDATVFMSLRSMATRLMFDESEEAVDDVLELMWETALHLEDGSLSLAARELRELQEALNEALANDASDEELQRLMDELRQALDNYLDALAQQQQQMADQPMQPMDSDAMTVERQDLQEMLDSLSDMIETGAREAAQQMLSQLQELLENLQVGQQSSQMQQGQQMMNDLQELIQRQQQLLDETFGLSREQGQEGAMDRQGQQQGQQGQQQGQRGQQGQQGQSGQMEARPGSQPGQNGQQGPIRPRDGSGGAAPGAR